jgi:hypothetical protein
MMLCLDMARFTPQQSVPQGQPLAPVAEIRYA